MNWVYAFVFSLDFIIAKDFTLNDLGNIFALAKDENSKILSAKSHMDCINKCAKRKNCNLFNSYFVPKTTLTSAGYKCGFTKDPKVYLELYNLSNSCETKANLMTKIPMAIAGACSDHDCDDGQVCKPRDSGGYRCDRERGRNRGRKHRPTGKRGG